MDEGLRTAEDLVQVLSLSAADAAVAKVLRSAGPWRSRQLCELAEAAGLVLAASGLRESDIGLAAGLHLCSRFGITDVVDLNGRQFLESPFVGRTVELDGAVRSTPKMVVKLSAGTRLSGSSRSGQEPRQAGLTRAE